MDKFALYITTKPNETLGQIARTKLLPLEDLLEANSDFTEHKSLPIGTDICVPVLAPLWSEPGPKPNYRVLRAGESLISIAKDTGIKLVTLIQNNPQIIHGFVLPGERVILG
jgi:hypothetical protein